MKIIGGQYRGRKLAKVTRGVRPTTNQLREALFNVLDLKVKRSHWVDAFSGSGAIGIEALSRGAKLVVFNDHNPKALNTVRSNLQKCQIETGYEIFNTDIFRLFQRLYGHHIDFVFLDPPYDFMLYREMLRTVSKNLEKPCPEHLVLLEVYKKVGNEVAGTQYTVIRRLRAGDSHLLFLKLAQKEIRHG